MRIQCWLREMAKITPCYIIYHGSSFQNAEALLLYARSCILCTIVKLVYAWKPWKSSWGFCFKDYYFISTKGRQYTNIMRFLTCYVHIKKCIPEAKYKQKPDKTEPNKVLRLILKIRSLPILPKTNNLELK